MTREDIIRMAREVGFDDFEQDDMLERFAALVAAHEREMCAKVCDYVATLPNDLMTDAPYIAAVIRARG